MKTVSAKGHRNASVAVAAYYIGRADRQPVEIAQKTAHSEGFTAPEDVWGDAMEIVNTRKDFTEPTT